MLSAPGLYAAGRIFSSGTRHISFGRDVYINGDIWIDAVTTYAGLAYKPSVRIGSRTSFSKNVHISAVNVIDIGEDVLFGSNIYVADHAHGEYRGSEQSSPATAPAIRVLGTRGKVVIGDRVWIGNNVVIVGTVTVGEGAIIAANSVINKDVPAATMVAGIPARIIKTYDYENQRWIAEC